MVFFYLGINLVFPSFGTDKQVDTCRSVRESDGNCTPSSAQILREKEPGLKKFVLVPIALLVLLLMTSLSCFALAEAEECNSIPWGDPLTTVEQLSFSHAAGGIKYYTVNKVEACGIAMIEDTRVTYGFSKGKLYTTIVEIDKAKDIKNVISILMDSYGLPNHKKEDGWDIYRWENDDLKIKLKSQYSTDRIKIGTYYKPLTPKE